MITKRDENRDAHVLDRYKMVFEGTWRIMGVGGFNALGCGWKAMDKGEVRALGDRLLVSGAADIEEDMGSFCKKQS